MVETEAQLERFCAETDPGLIALAPDVAHLVRGGAVVELDDTTHTPRESAAISCRYLHEWLGIEIS